MVKARMEDLDRKPADPAKAYGDKGTIAKCSTINNPLPNHDPPVQQNAAHFPPELLIKEYKLRP